MFILAFVKEKKANKQQKYTSGVNDEIRGIEKIYSQNDTDIYNLNGVIEYIGRNL